MQQVAVEHGEMRFRDRAKGRMGWRSDACSEPARQSNRTRMLDFRDTLRASTSRLPEGFSIGLIRQFENMFDGDNWEPTDELPTKAALNMFIRFLDGAGALARPGLGLNPNGQIVASWRGEKSHFWAEFSDTGMAKWFSEVDGGGDHLATIAGVSEVDDLLKMIPALRQIEFFSAQ